MSDSETYVFEPHVFKQMKGIKKLVCDECGLVRLQNKFTDWSIKMGCLSHLHSGYKSARVNLVKQ